MGKDLNSLFSVYKFDFFFLNIETQKIIAHSLILDRVRRPLGTSGMLNI